MSKVFVVVEIKNYFVACHVLKVYEVLDWNRLVRDASSCAYSLYLYFIRCGGSTWKSEWQSNLWNRNHPLVNVNSFLVHP
jgi:hypothetical protein